MTTKKRMLVGELTFYNFLMPYLVCQTIWMKLTEGQTLIPSIKILIGVSLAWMVVFAEAIIREHQVPRTVFIIILSGWIFTFIKLMNIIFKFY